MTLASFCAFGWMAVLPFCAPQPEAAVGYVEGEGADAIVARIEANLTDGKLKAAASEWEKLPEAGKEAGAEFKASLDARIKVEDLVGSTLSKAISTTEPKG